MKMTLTLALAALAVGHTVPAAAQQESHNRSLAATCTTCHGTEGRSVGGVPPSLAGQNRAYMLQQLMEFKSGRRPATIMHQHAKGYSDEQLERIASYFSSLTPGPAVAAPAAR